MFENKLKERSGIDMSCEQAEQRKSLTLLTIRSFFVIFLAVFGGHVSKENHIRDHRKIDRRADHRVDHRVDHRKIDRRADHRETKQLSIPFEQPILPLRARQAPLPTVRTRPSLPQDELEELAMHHLVNEICYAKRVVADFFDVHECMLEPHRDVATAHMIAEVIEDRRNRVH